MSKKRYELRDGRFGYYFRDTLNGEDMSLSIVEETLNEGDEALKRLEELDDQLASGI